MLPSQSCDRGFRVMNDSVLPASFPGEEPRDEMGEASQARTIHSESILQGQQEVMIAHGKEMYRLRLTRNGKLILHK